MSVGREEFESLSALVLQLQQRIAALEAPKAQHPPTATKDGQASPSQSAPEKPLHTSLNNGPTSDRQGGHAGQQSPQPTPCPALMPAAVPTATTRVVMHQIILPSEVDNLGICFGGQVLSWIDVCAGMSAKTLAKVSCVTASVDAVHFLRPCRLGTVVIVAAQVNRTFNSSMEVGVRVESEDMKTGARYHCCSAYLTFVVAPNRASPQASQKLQASRPSLPRVLPSNPSHARVYEAAQDRREARLKARAESRSNPKAAAAAELCRLQPITHREGGATLPPSIILPAPLDQMHRQPSACFPWPWCTPSRAGPSSLKHSKRQQRRQQQHQQEQAVRHQKRSLQRHLTHQISRFQQEQHAQVLQQEQREQEQLARLSGDCHSPPQQQQQRQRQEAQHSSTQHSPQPCSSKQNSPPQQQQQQQLQSSSQQSSPFGLPPLQDPLLSGTTAMQVASGISTPAVTATELAERVVNEAVQASASRRYGSVDLDVERLLASKGSSSSSSSSSSDRDDGEGRGGSSSDDSSSSSSSSSSGSGRLSCRSDTGKSRRHSRTTNKHNAKSRLVQPQMWVTPNHTVAYVTQSIMPQHANTLGITFGGQVMSWMEQCAYISASRLRASHILTAAMDSVSFAKSTKVGDIMYITSQVTAMFMSSLEVLVSVHGEDPQVGDLFHCADAFITLVTVSSDCAKPMQLPFQLQPVNDVDRLRQEGAIKRRAARLQMRADCAQAESDTQSSLEGSASPPGSMGPANSIEAVNCIGR